MLNRKEIEKEFDSLGVTIYPVEPVRNFTLSLPIRVLEELREDIETITQSPADYGGIALSVEDRVLAAVLHLIDQHLARYRLNEKEDA